MVEPSEAPELAAEATDTAETLAARADELFEAGRLDDARERYWELCERFPDTPAAEGAADRLLAIETLSAERERPEPLTRRERVGGWIALALHSVLAALVGWEALAAYARVRLVDALFPEIVIAAAFACCGAGLLAALQSGFPASWRTRAVMVVKGGSFAMASWLLANIDNVVEAARRRPDAVLGQLLPVLLAYAVLVVVTMRVLRTSWYFAPPRWLSYATFSVAALALSIRTWGLHTFLRIFFPSYGPGLTSSLDRARQVQNVIDTVEWIALVVWIPWAVAGALRGRD